MRKPKLLFLCQTYPYPPDGGVWIRSYNILRLLAKSFDVTLLCFERAISAEDGFGNADTGHTAMAELARVEVFPIPQRHSRLRFFWDHFRSAATQRVFTRYLYESTAFRRRLEELLATEEFDVVHMDSLDLSGYLPALEGLPVLCTHHNVESRLLGRRVAIESNPAVKAYVRLQERLTRNEERRWGPRVELNLTVSPEDAEEFRRIAPGGRYEVVPNGVDVEYFRPQDGPTSGLVFVGGANWFPNRDALEYFCADILPLVRTTHPGTEVRWIGAAREDDRRTFREAHNVDLTGYVDDIRPMVASSACYIVPIRVGGGSRLKILDAWAMGKAVVSTSTGCEGLSAEHGRNILIADTPVDFAAAVDRVLRDADLRAQLGRGARETVEREYAWEAIGHQMLPYYEQAMATARPSGSARQHTALNHLGAAGGVR